MYSRTRKSILTIVVSLFLVAIIPFVSGFAASPEAVEVVANSVRESRERENAVDIAPTSERDSLDARGNSNIDPRSWQGDHEYDNPEIIAEYISKRTASSKTFLQADGTYVMQIFEQPIHFFDGVGYREIDNTINRNLENTANSFNVSFDRNDALVVMEAGSGSFSMAPVFEMHREVADVRVFDGLGELDTVTSIQRTSRTRTNQNQELIEMLSRPTFSNNAFSVINDLEMDEDLQQELQNTLTRNNSSIYFANIFDGIDFQYTIQGQSIQESMIIHSPLGEYDFRFQLDLAGFTVQQNPEPGNLYIMDQDEIIFVIQTGHIVDFNGVYSELQFNFEQTNGNHFLTVTPCERFMVTAAFPVTINPTLTQFQTTGMRVGSYERRNRNQPSDTFHANVNLLREWNAFIDINHILDLPSILRDSVVISSELSLNVSALRDHTVRLKETTNTGNLHNARTIRYYSVARINPKVFDITDYVTKYLGRAILSIEGPRYTQTIFSNPRLRVFYQNKDPYFFTQNLGNMGTGLVDLNSGALNFVYDSVAIEDGFMPMSISHFYQVNKNPEDNRNKFHVGNDFILNFHQHLTYEVQEGRGFYVFTDALGRRYYFADTTMYNPRLGMRLHHANNKNFLVDHNGNSLVFSWHGVLLEVHQFPSTFENPRTGMWLRINYVSQPAERWRTDTFRISNITNGNTTVTFVYFENNGPLSRLRYRVGNGILHDLFQLRYSAVSSSFGRRLQTIERVTTEAIGTRHITRLEYNTNGNLIRVFEDSNVSHRVEYTYNTNRVTRIDTHIRENGMNGTIREGSQDIVNISMVSSNETQTTILNTQNKYFRHVTFRGNNVVSDYSFEQGAGFNITPFTAFSSGFEAIEFTNAFATSRDLPLEFRSSWIDGDIYTTRLPEQNTNNGGIHDFVFFAWVRILGGTDPGIELNFHRIGNTSTRITRKAILNTNVTGWQYIAVRGEVAHAVDYRELTISTSGIILISDPRVVQLQRQWNPLFAREFVPEFNNNGQITRAFRYNEIDDTVSRFDFEYIASPGLARYPNHVRSITEHIAPATARNQTQFDQQRSREGRIEFGYTDGRLTSVKTLGTGTQFQETLMSTSMDGRTTSHTDVNGIRNITTNNSNGSVTNTLVGRDYGPSIITTRNFQQGTGLLNSLTTGTITTGFGYNDRGQLNRVTHNGFDTLFNYHGDGSLHTVQVPGRTLMTTTSSRTQETVMFGNNQTTQHSFNSEGLLKTITNSDGRQHTFGYERGQLASVKNANGVVNTFENNIGNVSNRHSVQNGASSVRVDQSRPGENRILNRYYFNNGLQDHYNIHFNGRGQISHIDKGAVNGRIDYGYDGLHRLISQSKTYLGQSFRNSLTYRSNTDQLSRSQFFVNNNIRTDSVFSWHENGMLEYIAPNGVDSNTHYDVWFYYDSYGRLFREYNRLMNRIFEFHYDSGGNISVLNEYTIGWQWVTQTLFFYDNPWRDLLTRKRVWTVAGWGPDQHISYDGAGNPTNWNGRNYHWENGRQLAGVNSNIRYEYDFRGLRTRKIVSNVTTNYYLDEVGRVLARQVPGRIGEWFFYDDLGVYGMQHNGTNFMFERNILGDIVAIYNMHTGILQGRYIYDAWGNHTFQNANGQAFAPAATHILNINPFRWRGKYFDNETGLYYLQSRYYDPTIGRFINPDDPRMLFTEAKLAPASGANLFMFAYNNPVMYTDRTGYGFFTALLIGTFILAVAGGGVVGGVIAHNNDGNVFQGVVAGMFAGAAIWGACVFLVAVGAGAIGAVASVKTASALGIKGAGMKATLFGVNVARLGAIGSLAMSGGSMMMLTTLGIPYELDGRFRPFHDPMFDLRTRHLNIPDMLGIFNPLHMRSSPIQMLF